MTNAEMRSQAVQAAAILYSNKNVPMSDVLQAADIIASYINSGKKDYRT